jgi:N12 class adenine-specific DNA methylase
LESFMTAMISGLSLPTASCAQRRAFPAILSPKHLAAVARLAAEIKTHHMPELASWTVEACQLGWTAAGTLEWGTDCRHGGELLADALNSPAPQISDTIKDGDGERRVFNVVDAEAAKTKLQKIKDEFQRWIWSDPDRTDRLARRFKSVGSKAGR